MKIKNLLFTVCLFLAIKTAIAQRYKQYNEVASNEAYLTYHKHSIKFTDLRGSTIIGLLGTPLQIKKDRSDIPNVSAITYIYPEGEISTEGVLSAIKITKPGWAFSFNINHKLSGPFAVGSAALPLKKLFPLSSKSSRKNNTDNLSIAIKKCDCGIAFILNKGVIKAIYFSTNDS